MSRHENSQLGPDTLLSRRNLLAAGAIGVLTGLASGCSLEGSSGEPRKPDVPSRDPGEANRPSPKDRSETPEVRKPEIEPSMPKSVVWREMIGDQKVKIEQVPTVTGPYGGLAYGDPKGRSEEGGYNTMGWHVGNSKLGEESPKVLTVHTTLVTESLLPRSEFEEKTKQMKKPGRSMDVEFQGENGETYVYRIYKLDKTGKGKTEYGKLMRGLSEEYGDKDVIIIITCSGNPSEEIGTSDEATVLVGIRES